MNIETFVLGPFQSNCTLLACPTTRQAVLVDPGDDAPRLLAELAARDLTLVRILLTHGHLDHVCGVEGLRAASGASVGLHRSDRQLYDRVAVQAMAFGLQAEQPGPPDEELVHGQRIEFGAGHEIVVIHTPGHSPGGVCFHLPGAALAVVGDTLFQGSIGRTDLWGGDYDTLLSSIRERLLVLPAETRIICGHGPDSTIGREARSNPFLR